MGHERNSWTTFVAAVCFLCAFAVAAVALLSAVSIVREYGPAEGYGNLAVQSLPIVVVGLILAGLLTWAGTRVTRRHHNRAG